MKNERKTKWMSLLLLVAGVFTFSLTSCGDDDDPTSYNETGTPSALKHTWEVVSSTNGSYPLTGVDDVVIDLSSGNTMRFIVLLQSSVASATGTYTNQYYLLPEYTFQFTCYTKSGTKGELRSSTNGTFPYEIVSGGVNLTIGSATYGLEQTSLSKYTVNPLPPDAVYNYVK